MVGYRRNKPRNSNAEFFLTIATQIHKTRFTTDNDLNLVYDATGVVRDRFRIKFHAWVILPDHVHWLIAPGDADYSKVVASFKKRVSYIYRMNGLLDERDKFWQDRFWEHTVRDDEDRERCIEYIHYNPVKHGLADSPGAWRYSSFHKYVERDLYHSSWGNGADVDVPGAEYD